LARVAGQRRFVAALLALLAGVAPGSAAGAVDEGVHGRSTDRGVEIEVERFTPGRIAAGAGTTDGARRSGGTCSLFPWIFDPGTAKGGIPPTREHRRFIVICDGRPLGTRWIGPADPLGGVAATAVAIAAVAERVVRELPIGGVAVDRRPRGRSLTGVPVYLWVAGYDGRPLARTVSELGVTVDVRVSLQSVSWDFGDGTPPVLAGLGEPWPRRSSVRHVYGTSSPESQPYAVAATLVLAAGYRVDGGPWHPLAPITRSAGTSLDVDEVQAVRHR
jgi:hypothetical protein